MSKETVLITNNSDRTIYVSGDRALVGKSALLFTKEEDVLIRSQIREITITGGITSGIMGIINK